MELVLDQSQGLETACRSIPFRGRYVVLDRRV